MVKLSKPPSFSLQRFLSRKCKRSTSTTPQRIRGSFRWAPSPNSSAPAWRLDGSRPMRGCWNGWPRWAMWRRLAWLKKGLEEGENMGKMLVFMGNIWENWENWSGFIQFMIGKWSKNNGGKCVILHLYLPNWLPPQRYLGWLEQAYWNLDCWRFDCWSSYWLIHVNPPLGESNWPVLLFLMAKQSPDFSRKIFPMWGWTPSCMNYLESFLGHILQHPPSWGVWSTE